MSTVRDSTAGECAGRFVPTLPWRAEPGDGNGAHGGPTGNGPGADGAGGTGAAFPATGDPGVSGARRDGGGVQGAPEIVEPAGCAETARAGKGAGREVRRTVRPGSAGAGAVESSEHRNDL